MIFDHGRIRVAAEAAVNSPRVSEEARRFARAYCELSGIYAALLAARVEDIPIDPNGILALRVDDREGFPNVVEVAGDIAVITKRMVIILEGTDGLESFSRADVEEVRARLLEEDA